MSMNDSDQTEAPELDRVGIEKDIAAGAKAFRELLANAGLEWTHWSATILGLRGLRSLAYAKAGTTSMQSQAFRDAMSTLLQLRKYAVYDQMDKQARSDCYRLMDRLEDVNDWYNSQVSVNDKMRWKHPGTIAKHCPKEYLSGMRAHNKPPRITTAKKKPPMVNFETERLKALMMILIKELLRLDPQNKAALAALDQIHPSDPSDDIPSFSENEAETD